MALTKYAADDRIEASQRTYESAVALRKMLEEKMDIRAKIIRTNTNLLQELEKVSNLNQSIMEHEIFTTEKSQQSSEKLLKEKENLKKFKEWLDSDSSKRVTFVEAPKIFKDQVGNDKVLLIPTNDEAIKPIRVIFEGE